MTIPSPTAELCAGSGAPVPIPKRAQAKGSHLVWPVGRCSRCGRTVSVRRGHLRRHRVTSRLRQGAA